MVCGKTILSYDRFDSAFVLKLEKDLRAAGVDIWLDQLIEPGSRWDVVIENAIKASECLIVVLTPASVSSPNVMDEFSFALDEDKRLVPILFKDCFVPFRLRRFQYIDFRGDYAPALEQLIKTLYLQFDQKVVNDEEDIMWQNANQLQSIKVFVGYLRQYPDGKFKMTALDAIDRITQIEDEYQKLAIEKERQSWISNRLDDIDINEIAAKCSLEYAAIKAVIKVETGGGGFLLDGRPKILFEGHIFWNELKRINLKPEEYEVKFPDIVYPHWTKQNYKGGTGEYERLEKAKLIHEEAALKSASWGLFQIMGFSYEAAGFANVKAFVEAQYLSEKEQLKAFINFISYKYAGQAKATIDFLREKDWKGFANRYNGPRYSENQYGLKLELAYKRFASESV